MNAGYGADVCVHHEGRWQKVGTLHRWPAVALWAQTHGGVMLERLYRGEAVRAADVEADMLDCFGRAIDWPDEVEHFLQFVLARVLDNPLMGVTTDGSLPSAEPNDVEEGAEAEAAPGSEAQAGEAAAEAPGSGQGAVEKAAAAAGKPNPGPRLRVVAEGGEDEPSEGEPDAERPDAERPEGESGRWASGGFAGAEGTGEGYAEAATEGEAEAGAGEPGTGSDSPSPGDGESEPPTSTGEANSEETAGAKGQAEEGKEPDDGGQAEEAGAPSGDEERRPPKPTEGSAGATEGQAGPDEQQQPAMEWRILRRLIETVSKGGEELYRQHEDRFVVLLGIADVLNTERTYVRSKRDRRDTELAANLAVLRDINHGLTLEQIVDEWDGTS